MRHFFSFRSWAVAWTAVTILTLVAGTSVACLQKGSGGSQLAHACCKDKCHHVIKEALASKCCQSHQHTVARTIPLSPGVKPPLLVDVMLSMTPLSIVAVGGQERGRALLFPIQHPPPLCSLYTLHCSFLI